MQTADYSSAPGDASPVPLPRLADRPCPRATHRIAVTPIVPRGRALRARGNAQDSRDGEEEAEAHPS